MILCALAVLLRVLFAYSEPAYNQFYLQGCFPVIRSFQSSIAFLWIIPGYYLLLISAALWLAWRWPRVGNYRRFGRRLGNLFGGCAAVFLGFWGMNYADAGIAHRMNLPEAPESVAPVELYLELAQAAAAARQGVKLAHPQGPITSATQIPTDAQINSWVAAELQGLGYATHTPAPVVAFTPKGMLRRMGISGIYNPFTGEANFDASLPNIQSIFTRAHEVAHAYGVTDEGDANFAAWLACAHSGHDLAEYAAAYALWRHSAAPVNNLLSSAELEALLAAVPAELLLDRAALLASYHRYQAFFPELSEGLNDTYLQLQGVEAGVDSYDQFLRSWLRYSRSHAQ